MSPSSLVRRSCAMVVRGFALRSVMTDAHCRVPSSYRKNTMKTPCIVSLGGRWVATFVFALAVLLTSTLHATNGTWNVTSGTWDTSATNWTGVTGTPWSSTNGPSNVATFNTSGTATINGSVYAQQVNVQQGMTINGGTLNISGGVAQNNGAIFLTATSYTTLGCTIAISGASTQISGYDSYDTTYFNNPIIGTGDLYFAGAGGAATHGQTWYLQGGASTYSGNTYVGYNDFGGGALPDPQRRHPAQHYRPQYRGLRQR